MEVVEPCAHLLSNFEVYSLLLGMRSDLKQQPKADKSHGLSTILYQTLKYLEQSPARALSEAAIVQILTELNQQEFDLTKAEKLQLVNHLPTRSVELQLLIEECVDRVSEDREQALLELIARAVPQQEAGRSGDPMEDTEFMQ